MWESASNFHIIMLGLLRSETKCRQHTVSKRNYCMPYGILLHAFPAMSYTLLMKYQYISNLNVANIVQYGISARSNSVYWLRTVHRVLQWWLQNLVKISRKQDTLPERHPDWTGQVELPFLPITDFFALLITIKWIWHLCGGYIYRVLRGILHVLPIYCSYPPIQSLQFGMGRYKKWVAKRKCAPRAQSCPDQGRSQRPIKLSWIGEPGLWISIIFSMTANNYTLPNLAPLRKEGQGAVEYLRNMGYDQNLTVKFLNRLKTKQ